MPGHFSVQFNIATSKGFHIRWFTPSTEVDLCGHATMAAAFVLFQYLDYKDDTIVFESKSGVLTVSKAASRLVMDFPAQPPIKCKIPNKIEEALGIKPIECLRSKDYVVVLNDESDVLMVKPNFSLLSKIDLRGVIVTSESEKYDFVSRFFGPKCGIDEDPVTGSSHTQLAPYWSKQLGKKEMLAKQLSSRGGELYCEISGNRVKISGNAVKYLQGEIEI